jgi:hypothetical protein
MLPLPGAAIGVTTNIPVMPRESSSQEISNPEYVWQTEKQEEQNRIEPLEQRLLTRDTPSSVSSQDLQSASVGVSEAKKIRIHQIREEQTRLQERKNRLLEIQQIEEEEEEEMLRKEL